MMMGLLLGVIGRWQSPVQSTSSEESLLFVADLFAVLFAMDDDRIILFATLNSEAICGSCKSGAGSTSLATIGRGMSEELSPAR